MNETITAFSIEDDIIQIKILNGPRHPKMIAKIFDTFFQEGVNIDMISQVSNEETTQIELTCDQQYQKQLNAAIEKLTDSFANLQIYLSRKYCKIALGGKLMETTPGVAALVFKTLGESNIHFAQISTSKRTISLLIDKKNRDVALEKLQERFNI